MKELLGHPNNKKVAKVLKASKNLKVTKVKPVPKALEKLNLGLPAYPWSANSCWLDASLQVLYMAVTRNFDEFATICKPLDPEIVLGALYVIFQERFDLDFNEGDASAILETQRDALRLFLQKKKIISSLNKPESAVVCLK